MHSIQSFTRTAIPTLTDLFTPVSSGIYEKTVLSDEPLVSLTPSLTPVNRPGEHKTFWVSIVVPIAVIVGLVLLTLCICLALYCAVNLLIRRKSRLTGVAVWFYCATRALLTATLPFGSRRAPKVWNFRFAFVMGSLRALAEGFNTIGFGIRHLASVPLPRSFVLKSLHCSRVMMGSVAADLYVPSSPTVTLQPWVILYLHGGAYTLCSAATYRFILPRFVTALDIPCLVFCIDYRRPPRYPYPAARDDALEAYRWLVTELGYPPANIAVVGDSAGGGLAFSIAYELRDALREGRPDAVGLPACVAAISPWVDLTAAGLSYPSVTEARRSDFITPTAMPVFVNAYVSKRDGSTVTDPATWGVSPGLVPDASGLPPVFIEYGGGELLRGQIEAFIDRLRAARSPGCECPNVLPIQSAEVVVASSATSATDSFSVELVVPLTAPCEHRVNLVTYCAPHMPHVFPIFGFAASGRNREPHNALIRMRLFIRAMLEASAAPARERRVGTARGEGFVFMPSFSAAQPEVGPCPSDPSTTVSLPPSQPHHVTSHVWTDGSATRRTSVSQQTIQRVTFDPLPNASRGALEGSPRQQSPPDGGHVLATLSRAMAAAEASDTHCHGSGTPRVQKDAQGVGVGDGRATRSALARLLLPPPPAANAPWARRATPSSTASSYWDIIERVDPVVDHTRGVAPVDTYDVFDSPRVLAPSSTARVPRPDQCPMLRPLIPSYSTSPDVPMGGGTSGPVSLLPPSHSPPCALSHTLPTRLPSAYEAYRSSHALSVGDDAASVTVRVPDVEQFVPQPDAYGHD